MRNDSASLFHILHVVKFRILFLPSLTSASWRRAQGFVKFMAVTVSTYSIDEQRVTIDDDY